ncbi:hypothetical protein J2X69_004166 [Algoriphagus sp. 4150]|nr:hypothetical protein [Algoriphagus sp. 4150]
MKSSMTPATHNLSRTCFGRGMIINPARFSRSAAADGTGYPVSFVTGQVVAIKNQIINT